jgi:hypothetical protein
MTHTNITPLRPKAKDPTGAQRQARFRKRRKGIVTENAICQLPEAPAPVTRLTDPPPLAGRGEAVTPHNGAGIDFAAYAAATALAGAAAYFSIRGMTVLFPGAPTAIIAMAVAMEASKLVTAGWLARRWWATAWVLRGILVGLVGGLALINAAGVYAQLVSAHVGLRGEATSATETKDAALAARIEVATHAVADLDRRLNQVDVAIEEAAKRGRTNAALSAMEGQRKSREALATQRQREGVALADLKAERAAIGAKGKQIETEAAPIRYVAELLGTDTDNERAIRWLIALIVLCCDPLAISLTAAASARR